jgi:hypothetical protein
VTVRELAVLLRSLRSGTDAKLRYLREGRVLAGSGTL